MIRQRGWWLAALALLAALGGCGGGGGDGAAAGGEGLPTETRSFEFTVSVPNPTSPLGTPQFFVDQALTQPGVEIRSATQRLTTTTASVNADQQVVSKVDPGFQLAVHFDASGSIVRKEKDQQGLRFVAARGLISGVGSVAPNTTTRLFTFRSSYQNDFKQMLGLGRSFPASDPNAREQAINAAIAEGATANSPALTATNNIISMALPPGSPHAMLLLTDGENNAEDPAIVPGCQGTESAPGSGCSNIDNVVKLARERNVKVFVAGLGNNDAALSTFRNLASQTRAAFVKATRSETLPSQFSAIGALMTTGGVVVSGETGEVTIVQGGNPFVAGWIRFDKPAGGCPGGPSQEVPGTNFCRIQFGQ